jgi:serine/threonine protein kinase
MFETLGNGSYGKVKKCRNMGEGTTFAVKIVKKSILKRKRVGRYAVTMAAFDTDGAPQRFP